MYRMNKVLTLMVLAALLVSACQPIVAPAPGIAPAEAELAVPRFEPSECKYPILADADAECGYLVVREDRSNPDSRTIRVHVIKFRSASETPAPDPIIVLPGGPGAPGSFYAWLWAALPVGDVMRAERDVYLLETRGAMYSEPAFYCPETEADATERVGMGFAEEMDWLAEAYRACHDRLVAEGANFSAYGLPDIAGDVVDLRSALGIDQVNVYGVSYGTPPAMLLMRDNPAWVRSIILDSIIPPDADFVESLLEGAAGVVQAVFAACTADPVCEAAYPNLDAVFSDLLAQLRQAPVSVTVTDEAGQEHVVIVDDVKFFHYVWDSTWVGDGFASLPAMVYGAAQGDLFPAAQAWLDFVSSSHSSVAAADGSWARGLTYATMCLQEGSKTDLAAVIAAYEQVDVDPTLRDWALAYQTLENISPCEYWNVTPPEPNVAIEPVTSDLPALMLTGAFDPVTPPSLSRAAAERLPNSYFYELPAGHGLILTECALDLIAQFLADPTQTPDSTCIGEMTPSWVLPEE